MKSSIMSLFLFVSFAVGAVALPEGHFLYPRDKEVLWISGVEEAVSFNELRSLTKQCKVVREFDSCEWIENFKLSQNQTLDSFQFIEQIIFLGERHIDLTHQAALKDIIEKNDFNVLALEMFNSSDQASLDNYLKDQITSDELEEVLSRGWNYESSGYMQAIESAKKKGMKILGLDNRPAFDREEFSENLRKRDEHMAEVLNQYLKNNSKYRILVYSGKMHAFKSHSNENKLKSLPQLVNAEDKASYFLFGPKEKNLMTHSARLFLDSEQSFVIKSQSFDGYIDAAIFLKGP